MKAGTSERIGASEKRNRFAPAGMMSSLKKSLIPSAIGCRVPYGPTSMGPMRSCIQLKTLRSARVRKATVSRTTPMTTVILTTAAPAKTSISIRYVPPSIVAEGVPSPVAFDGATGTRAPPGPTAPTFSTVTVICLLYGTPVTGSGVTARRDPTVHAGGLRRCPQDPVTGDSLADLLQDLLRIAVFERIAHQDGEGRQNLPVRPAVAERVKPLPDLLHRALRVRERAVLLGVGARRQHDVGQPGGLRHEELLHDQQVQLLQRLVNFQRGREAPHGVLADDDHSLEPSAPRRFDHLEQAHPFRNRWLLLPDSSEQALCRHIGDVGRAGQVLGHRAHLDGALLVVLLGERREAPARLGQLADEQQEVQQANSRLIAARSLQ